MNFKLYSHSHWVKESLHNSRIKKILFPNDYSKNSAIFDNTKTMNFCPSGVEPLNSYVFEMIMPVILA